MACPLFRLLNGVAVIGAMKQRSWREDRRDFLILLHIRQRRDPEDLRFRPGWYAIDRESILRQAGDYRYSESLQPVAHAGYGFQIYEITPEIASELNDTFFRVEYLPN